MCLSHNWSVSLYHCQLNYPSIYYHTVLCFFTLHISITFWFIHQLFYQSIILSLGMYVCVYVCTYYVCVYVSVSVGLSTSIYVNFSVCLSLSLFTSICPFLCPSVYPSIYVSANVILPLLEIKTMGLESWTMPWPTKALCGSHYGFARCCSVVGWNIHPRN